MLNLSYLEFESYRKEFHIGRIVDNYKYSENKHLYIIYNPKCGLRYFICDIDDLWKSEYVVYLQKEKNSNEVEYIGNLYDFKLQEGSFERVNVGSSSARRPKPSADNNGKRRGKFLLYYEDKEDVYDFCLWSHGFYSFIYSKEEKIPMDLRMLQAYKNNKKENKDYIEIAHEIKDKVETLDIKKIINSYNVSVNSHYNVKVGGDDYYEISYETQIDYKDEYIKLIFPSYYETLYEDRGFTITYPPDDELDRWKKFALSKTKTNKKNALLKYNAEDHKMVLMASYIRKLEQEEKKILIKETSLHKEEDIFWKKYKQFNIYVSRNDADWSDKLLQRILSIIEYQNEKNK